MTDMERLLEEDLDMPLFESEAQAAAYYKTLAKSLQSALRDTKRHLDEFEAESRDYEQELEHTIETMEAQQKEYKSAINVLQLDLDHWKSKYQEDRESSDVQQEALMREIQHLRQMQQEFQHRTRALELDNDDLERHGRAAESSKRDLELKLAAVVKRNSFLEGEQEVKQRLVVVVQRLKDELRDLQLELSVLKSRQSMESLDGAVQKPVEASAVTTPPVSGKEQTAADAGQESAARTLSRAEGKSDPVKMVQEMLGRVRSLESRLVNCRTLVSPMLGPPPSYTATANARTSTGSAMSTSTPRRSRIPTGGQTPVAAGIASQIPSRIPGHRQSLPASSKPLMFSKAGATPMTESRVRNEDMRKAMEERLRARRLQNTDSESIRKRRGEASTAV